MQFEEVAVADWLVFARLAHVTLADGQELGWLGVFGWWIFLGSDSRQSAAGGEMGGDAFVLFSLLSCRRKNKVE